MPRSRVGYFKFLLEGHDNLALMSFVDRFSSVVQLIHSPESRAEVLAFLESIRDEVGLRILPVGVHMPGQGGRGKARKDPGGQPIQTGT